MSSSNDDADFAKSLYLFLTREEYSHVSEMPVRDLVHDDLTIEEFYCEVDNIVARANDLLTHRDAIFNSIMSDIAEENLEAERKEKEWLHQQEQERLREIKLQRLFQEQVQRHRLNLIEENKERSLYKAHLRRSVNGLDKILSSV